MKKVEDLIEKQRELIDVQIISGVYSNVNDLRFKWHILDFDQYLMLI